MSQRRTAEFKRERELQNLISPIRKHSVDSFLSTPVRIIWKSKSNPELINESWKEKTLLNSQPWKISRKKSVDSINQQNERSARSKSPSPHNIKTLSDEMDKEPLRRTKSLNYVRPLIKSHISSDKDLNVNVF